MCRCKFSAVAISIAFLVMASFPLNVFATEPLANEETVQPTYPGDDEWVLTFEDDFDGTELDSSKWSVRGQEYQTYHDESCVSVEDGNLVLAIKNNPNGTVGGNPTWLGRIDTHASMDTSETKWSQQYGFFECRAKIPPTKKTYFAFWMSNYPGMQTVGNDGRDGCEIDITETVKVGDYTESTLHWDGYGSSHRSVTSGSRPAPGIHDGYHIFGLEWTPDTLIFYFDGVETWRYSGPGVPRVPEVLILSSGYASWGEGTFNASELPYYAYVDWVRAYQKVDEEQPSDNLLYNAGFEGGELSPFENRWGSAAVTDLETHTGDFSVQLNPSSSVQQTITGLSPNTTYVASAFVKTEDGNQIRLAVNNYGGDEVRAESTSSNWQQIATEFTTGQNNTSATVLLFKGGIMGDGIAWGDDLEVVAKSDFKYTVDVQQNTGGSISVQPAKASPGESIVVTVQPDEGWLVDGVSYYANGETNEIQKTNGRYTFVMPSGAVYVTAQFTQNQSTNLLQNAGFESGSYSPFYGAWGSKEIIQGSAYEGEYCVCLSPSSSLEQVVSGLEPNTTYVLSGALKADNGNTIRLAAADYGGEELQMESSATDWQEVTGEFTTDSTHTSVRLILYKAGSWGDGNAYADALSLVKKTW